MSCAPNEFVHFSPLFFLPSHHVDAIHICHCCNNNNVISTFPLVCYRCCYVDFIFSCFIVFVCCRHSNLTQQMLIFKAALCVMHLIVIQTYSPWTLSTYRFNPNKQLNRLLSGTHFVENDKDYCFLKKRLTK